MLLFVQDLPDNKRMLANVIQMEGQNVAKYALRASFDTSASSARTLISAVTQRRHTWLRSSLLALDTRIKAEDLPFGLVSEKT